MVLVAQQGWRFSLIHNQDIDVPVAVNSLRAGMAIASSPWRRAAIAAFTVAFASGRPAGVEEEDLSGA